MRYEDWIPILLVAVPALLLLLLMTYRWFWIAVFGVGGLAAAFATLASIFHFQILGALAFFFLMMVCWGIAIAIMESDPGFRR